jgi:hypothetical protein
MTIKTLRPLIAVALVGAVAATLTASVRASSPAGRYEIGDETVSDTKTHLTWQRASAGPYDWMTAKTVCPGLTTGPGEPAWRLPTIKELQTLVDDSLGNTYTNDTTIDLTAFPATPREFFWSSTPAVASPDQGDVWAVHFGGGQANRVFSMADQHYVRCVR